MEATTMNSVDLRASRNERIAGAFVLVVLAVACVSWWVLLPAGWLWVLGQLTDDGATHLVGGVLGVPILMALFSPALFWLNGLYLRVTGILARLAADEEETGWRRGVRGPLEPMLFVSFVVAVIALSLWFFFVAENPSRQVI